MRYQLRYIRTLVAVDQATRNVLRNHIRSFTDTPNAQAKRVATNKKPAGVPAGFSWCAIQGLNL
ncbi:hypothetical protein [Gordonia oryzae]|uniref:hypothetical protein n=1 Tax=Gordonia oryzae TaxID=2487349 RepID=UPI000F4D3CE6|nr:hypothetical protein [Gordonia oryzae]